MLLKEVIGLLFAGIGTGLLVLTAWNAVQAIKSRAWPQCNGRIVISRIDTHSGEDAAHRASITYQYRIDDREYVGTRVRYCDWLWLSWRSPASALVRKFPAGTTVPVYYDRRGPSESVLEPGMNGFIFGSFAFGVFAVAIGLVNAMS
jgi:hypothetical protein